MENKTVSLDLIIPIEESLISRNLQFFERNFDFSKIGIIPIVSFRGEYILGDGHHRLFCLYEQGIREWEFSIAFNEDLGKLNQGIFRDFSSIEQITLQYVHFWKHDLDNLGIRRIWDYHPSKLGRKSCKFAF